jgi:hypothetical protein
MMADARKDLASLPDVKRRVQDQQDRLLDAHLEGALSIDVLTRKQTQLEEHLAVIDHQISEARADYAPLRANVDMCLALLTDPRRLYQLSDDPTKRLANQVIFGKIWADEIRRGKTGQRHAIRATVNQPIRDLHFAAAESQAHGAVGSDSPGDGLN